MEIKIVDSSFEKFLTSLGRETLAKTLRTIDLLETFGNKLGMPHSRKATGGIFELRIRGKKEVRILYVFQQNRAILLHGFVKKSKKLPSKELKTALRKLEILSIALLE